MTTFQIIKIALLSVAVIVFLFTKVLKKKKTVINSTDVENVPLPNQFYSIYDGNQNELIYAPEYNKEWFDELDKKFGTAQYNSYDNRFWEYMYGLHDTLYEISEEEDVHTFFNKLNRPQKMFYSFLMFNGDVDNGGIAQFFFNQPELIFAVHETFEELKITKLKEDYEKCLNEFLGTSESYAKRKEIFSNTNLEWEKRWNAFKDGYADIPSAFSLEEYYYDEEFKKSLFNTFTDYIDANLDLFVRK